MEEKRLRFDSYYGHYTSKFYEREIKTHNIYFLNFLIFHLLVIFYIYFLFFYPQARSINHVAQEERESRNWGPIIVAYRSSPMYTPIQF